MNKSTLIAAALLRGEAENITRKAIDLALSGNIPALWICLRILAPAASFGNTQGKSVAQLTRELLREEFRRTKRDVSACRAIVREISELMEMEA